MTDNEQPRGYTRIGNGVSGAMIEMWSQDGYPTRCRITIDGAVVFIGQSLTGSPVTPEGEAPKTFREAVREGARPFADVREPGRFDVDGIEWWACDPYPTWYRWEDGKLVTKSRSSGRWADE